MKEEYTWLWFRVPGPQAADRMEHVQELCFDNMIFDFEPDSDRVLELEEKAKKAAE